MQTLLSNVKFEEMVASGDRTGGTANINGVAVDMKGFEGCLINVEMGAITAGAVTSLKAQESDATGSGWTDIDDAEITIGAGDDNYYVRLDVANVRKRYLRGVVDRSTQNSALRSAQYIKYNASFLPTSQPSDDLTLIITPA